MRLPAAVAVLAGELSLVPTLLPRRPWVQGIFSGVVAANTYALVVVAVLSVASLHRRWALRRTVESGRRAWRRLDGHVDAVVWPALVNRAGILLLTAGFLAAVVGGRTTAVLLAARSDGPAPPLLGQLTAAVIGVAVAGALVLAARLLLSGVTRAVRYLVRARWATRLLLGGVVAAVIAATGSSVPVAGATSSPLLHPGAAWAAVQTRPQVRSGGAGSEVTWSSLDAKGREFLAGGPTAAAITAVTGRPAEESIRVYVGMHAAPTAQARSQIALREFRRTGGFDRSVIVIAVPTGSGWVNPAAPAALEYLYGGDVATVSVPYADVPSWAAYLCGLGAARETSRALLDTISAATGQLPPATRPRVVLYGESLGALSALSGLSPADAHSDAALWVGVPADAPAATSPDQVRLVHADDPVAIWTPRLLIGPTPQWQGAWFPLISFWQATADLAAAYDIPNGHGHRYAAEFVDAWNRIAPAHHLPGAAPATSFGAIRAAVLLGGG